MVNGRNRLRPGTDLARSSLIRERMAAPLRLHSGEYPGLRAEQRRLERAVAGRYRVIEGVSRGGMATVWRAFEPGIERQVALKLLAPSLCADEEHRGRFRREARILGSLAHPNIVPVLGFGEQDGTCWFAMPFLSGGTLEMRLAGGRLDADAARRILIQLADGLAYAHARGIVHRDLKAENVALDDADRPVLTDFGIATLATSDHSRSEMTKGSGTAHYMAPEQLAGSPDADGRVDLYALGVLGFRMLTGRFPFEGTAEQVSAQRLTTSAPPVAAYAAGVSPALAAAVDRCLARDPEDRWTDAAELRDALLVARVNGGFWKQTGAAVRRLFGRPSKAAALLML
jgi:serine/threonine-protein kinase